MHLFAHGCVPAPHGWFKVNTPWLAGGGLGTANELQSIVAPVPTVSFASTSKVNVVPWQAVSVSGTPIGVVRYVSETCPLPAQPELSAKLYVNATVPTKLAVGTNVMHLFAHRCVPPPQG